MPCLMQILTGIGRKGQWYNNKRHGRDVYRFCDGSKYKGEFAEDKIHGVGQFWEATWYGQGI
jgi:hypothetical protein